MPKAGKGFRFNPQLYASFKEIASKNGYTVTAALEKFMQTRVEHGLTFPASKSQTAEAEVRIMLTWLKEGKYWANLGDKQETSTTGLLLQLLPKIEDADLREELEKTLKKMP
jgi:hypothetical protein